MEPFGRKKDRRKGKEKTRKEKNVTETYDTEVSRKCQNDGGMGKKEERND